MIEKEFYEWCLKNDGGNAELYTYEEFNDMCDDMCSWFDEIQPLYLRWEETLK